MKCILSGHSVSPPTICRNWYFCNLLPRGSECNNSVVNMDGCIVIGILMIKDQSRQFCKRSQRYLLVQQQEASTEPTYTALLAGSGSGACSSVASHLHFLLPPFLIMQRICNTSVNTNTNCGCMAN